MSGTQCANILNASGKINLHTDHIIDNLSLWVGTSRAGQVGKYVGGGHNFFVAKNSPYAFVHHFISFMARIKVDLECFAELACKLDFWLLLWPTAILQQKKCSPVTCSICVQELRVD